MSSERISPIEPVGRLWNRSDIAIYDIGGAFYVAGGWNGEAYTNCWRVLDAKGLDLDEKHPGEYTLTPSYVFEAEGKSWDDVEKFEENSAEWNRLVGWSGFDISSN